MDAHLECSMKAKQSLQSHFVIQNCTALRLRVLTADTLDPLELGRLCFGEPLSTGDAFPDFCTRAKFGLLGRNLCGGAGSGGGDEFSFSRGITAS